MHTWKALVLGLSAALAWHGACAENLREVVEAALKTNPRVAAAAAEGRAAQQDVAQARAGYYPTVDVNLGGGRERTSSPQTRALNPSDSELSRRESGLTVSQRLFDGGAVRIDGKLAKKGDSGLYLRGNPQVQIWDFEQWKGVGSGG